MTPGLRLLLLVCLTSVCVSASECIVPIDFNTIIGPTQVLNATECLYKIDFAEDQTTRIFEVDLNSAATSGVQLILLDYMFNSIATIVVTEDHSSQLSLCRQEIDKNQTTSLESVFYISVVGDPLRQFTMEVRPLPGSQFKLNEPKHIQLGAHAKPHFFWATGIPRLPDIPLAFDVKSDKGSQLYKLHVSWNECPRMSNLGPAGRGNQLTFISQGRLVLFPSEVEEARVWYVGFAAAEEELNLSSDGGKKNITLTVTYSESLTDADARVMWGLAIGTLALIIAIALIASMLLCVDGFQTIREHNTELKEYTQANATRQRAKIFLWVCVMGFVFFWVPAIQNSNAQANAMWNTGNRDLCFYNDQCSVPGEAFGPYGFKWIATNNVISNTGYVLIGVLLYSYCTYLQKRRKGSSHAFRVMPLPQDYTLMYGLAAAIFAEGFLSATYHICPTRTIFQIDTAFMFVGTIMAMLEVYRKWFRQLPHPFFPLVILGSLLVFNFFGTLLDVAKHTTPYPTGFIISWGVIFSLLWISAVIFIVLRHRRYLHVLPLMFLTSVSSLIGCIPMLTILPSFNVDRASVLLGVAMLQLMLMLLFYLFGTMRKFDVTTRVVRVVVFLMGAGVWAGAVYFFGASPTNKNLEPALSRELNAPCLVANFYDAHDIWHMLSAIGLGIIGMLLLHAGESAGEQDIFSHHLPRFVRRSASNEDEPEEEQPIIQSSEKRPLLKERSSPFSEMNLDTDDFN